MHIFWKYINDSSLKSIIVQKIAFSSIYDIIMSPKSFWNKEQRFASLITARNRKLSTVPLNNIHLYSIGNNVKHIW